MTYSGQSRAPQRPTRSSLLLLLFAAMFCAGDCRCAQPASLNTARRLIQSGSYAEAASVLGSIVQSRPDDADAHLLLGEVFALEDQRSASIDQFSEAIRLRPNDSVTYNLLGNALSRFGENEAAEKALKTAIGLDPKLDSARVNLALILAQNNDLEGASTELVAAIRLQGNGSEAALSHYLLGKVQLAQNRPDAAASELEPRSRCSRDTRRRGSFWEPYGVRALQMQPHSRHSKAPWLWIRPMQVTSTNSGRNIFTREDRIWQLCI